MFPMTDPTSPDNIPDMPAPAALPAAPAAKPSGFDFGEPARFARSLTTGQISIAVDYLFRLDGYDSDRDLVAGIRQAYPLDYASAEKITTFNLGSAAEFKERAAKNFRQSPAFPRTEVRGRKMRRLAGIAAGFTAPAAAVLAAHRSSDTAAAAGIAGALIARTALSPRPRMPVVDDAHWERLREDIVNATLEGILSRSGDLNEDQSEALRRGFEHLSFISHTTAAMAVPPFVYRTPQKTAAP